MVSSSDDEEKFEDAKSSPDLEDRSLNMFTAKEKHIFVLSEAGKPIFSLHGEEDMMVSLGGLMQALVSFVADSGDTIKSIKTEDTNIVFLVKSPLILVGVSSTGLHTSQLTVQLLYIHSQIISVLTASQLNRIFEQRRNYDLRRLLSGSERLMTSLSQQMDRDHSYFLSAVKCLPLPTQDRNVISESVIRYAGKVKDVVFGILLADNHLISLVRMKKYFIHPADLHLVFNMINSTESFKHSESWTPLCLPKFDSSGFLHAHVSYLTDTSPACLLLVTTDRNAFFSLSEAKKKIVERLGKNYVSSSSILTFVSSRETRSHRKHFLCIEVRQLHCGEYRHRRDETLPLQVPDLRPVHFPRVQPLLPAGGEQTEAGHRLPLHPEQAGQSRLPAGEALPSLHRPGGRPRLDHSVVRAVRRLQPARHQAEDHHCRQQAAQVDQERGEQDVHPLCPDILNAL